MRRTALVSLFLLFSVSAFAQDVKPEQIYSGNQMEEISMEEVVRQIEPGTVLILSEQHDQKRHHDHQVTMLNELGKQNDLGAVSVGMEFFYYTDQKLVDQFQDGELSEESFLDAIKWGSGFPFEFYRSQVRFSRMHGGNTLALNAPRALTSKISKKGLDSLTDDDRALLPPSFSLGNEKYYQRFSELMTDGHVPTEKINNYFAAQSAWDDTMAWIATNRLKDYPSEVIVIIVGDFHAVYGGGLPSRLVARGAKNVLTISQVALGDMNVEEQKAEILPHPRWGKRADYIWTSK